MKHNQLPIIIMSVAALAAGSRPGTSGAAVRDIVTRSECREARFPVGTALTGREIAGRPNPGNVASIDRIRYDPMSRTVGFLYRTREGEAFVTDRPAAQLRLTDLAIMNQLVQELGSVHENAFDPRDNGFVYYRVAWKSELAKKMHLSLAHCP